MINTYMTKMKDIPVNVSDKVILWFYGDIHRFTRSCDVERWKAFLTQAKEDTKNNEHTYFIGMGDYDDFASTREKKDLVRMHETTIDGFDDIDQKRCRVLAQELSFTRGRTLGLIEGNHHWVRSNGVTSTQDLCYRLDAPYLGWLCHYSLIFQFYKKAGRNEFTNNIPFHLILCHGKAGGKTHGNTINQVGDLKLIFPAGDVYVMGHDHQRGAWPVSVLLPQFSKMGVAIKQKRQLLCRSGSFKKAYEDNTAGYEIGRLLKPADLGAIKIEIEFKNSKEHGGMTHTLTAVI